MRFMILVKASAASERGTMPSAELMQAMGRYNEELVAAGVLKAGDGLRPSRDGKRVHFDGRSRSVTDGPFAETKELVAGFWLWELPSMDDAVAWVRKCPNPMPDDSIIEIRPLYEAADFGDADFAEQQKAVRRRLDHA